MRKATGKQKWTDKELLDYDKLKDSTFEYYGIKILHVKEEDWKKDKQSCIDRCLEFLKS
jgi:hypothetical protein